MNGRLVLNNWLEKVNIMILRFPGLNWYILVKLQVDFVLNYVANCECFVVIKVVIRNCGC